MKSCNKLMHNVYNTVMEYDLLSNLKLNALNSATRLRKFSIFLCTCWFVFRIMFKINYLVSVCAENAVKNVSLLNSYKTST